LADRFEAAVLGLGIMGSAIAAELAGAGRRVIGLERGWPAHDLGSSGGESRMLRRAYPSYPAYGQLVAAARRAWLALEAHLGTTLFLPTGGLLVSGTGSAVLRDTITAARADDVPYRMLDAAQLRASFPALQFADDAEGFLDEEAGVLLAEPCVRAFQEKAISSGAELRFGVTANTDGLISRWVSEHSVEVDGVLVRADLLVLAIGPWLAPLAASAGWQQLSVERTTSHWLDPDGHAAMLDPRRQPFVVWEDPGDGFCMLPSLPGGVKVKFHHTGQAVDPRTGPRAVDDTERLAARTTLSTLAGLGLNHVAATVSMYTNTPDGRFLVASHPLADDLIAVSACSGHGFKFAPVIATSVAKALPEQRGGTSHRHEQD
jgi:sarcosine oxidase